jgi:hypothetical protein
MQLTIARIATILPSDVQSIAATLFNVPNLSHPGTDMIQLPFPIARTQMMEAPGVEEGFSDTSSKYP